MNKIKQIVKDFFAHWNKPAKGKYVSNKETIMYSVGGMGVQFIAAMAGYVALSANCYLIGSIYGIKPLHLGYMTTIMTLMTLIVTPIRSAIIDNNRSKKGKFRPFILIMGIPSALLILAMAFIPTNLDVANAYYIKLVLICVGACLINLCYNQFFFVGYTNLVQVMTPNSQERTNIISISSIIYSMAPTVTSAVIPLISNMFGGMSNIRTYRFVMPLFCIIGLAMSFLAYFGTKERIVVAKNYVAKVKFSDGIRKICKNKYFWIINVSAWISFSKAANGYILSWVYLYQYQSNTLMSVMGLVLGTASLVGMVTSPMLIKAFGKKKVVVYSNVLYAVASGLLVFCINIPVLFFMLTYLHLGAGSTALITGPAVGADVLDYQQWKTGDRLEGFSGNFGIIGSILGLATGLLVPYVTQYYGLLENYEILYNDEMRIPLFRMLCILGALGAVLAIIPYLFYDLSEDKHKKIIEELKERALEENHKLGYEETMEELENEIASN